MADAVSITIDGNQVEARPGELVIAAAERNGVYIPRFCWHPRMKPVGMCRMCLVEIKGPRGFSLQPACFVPAAEEMEVITTSEKVKKAQDGVLEFLLVNHPLDCPVCDRGGECPLQDQTLGFGPGESRFVEEKRHWEKPIYISDLVALDRERCIQCARCTRFADEIAGDPLIDFVGRGDHVEVATYPDSPFSSYFSGNTVQICPVGALTAKPYRFRARPWDLDQAESTCTTCAVGCRMVLQSSRDRLVRFLGMDDDAVNHGWLCDKGRFGHESVDHEDRIAHPLVRKGQDLVEVSWGEALAAVAKELAEVRDVHGAGAIAVLGGSRLTNEDAYAWVRLAKAVLGTDNVDAQLGDGLPAEAVLGVPRATIDDACTASTVVLLAPDLKEELPVLYLRLRAAAAEEGTALIELTPQATGLTPYAAHSLRYRPAEAPSVVRALLSDGNADAGGVPAPAIAAARARLRDAGDDVVVVLGRPSLAESADSIVEAAGMLAGALPGARFLPALRRANVHGALDMGFAPGILPGRVSLDDGRPWFRTAWGRVPEAPGMDATAILQAAAEGRVHALVLLGADPLADFPDRALARRALAAAGYVVAVDLFPTGSNRDADAVLPAAAFAERSGTTTNLEGRVSRLAQKVNPPGTARADWMIAAELAVHLGEDLGFESVDAISAEIERLAPAHAGLGTGEAAAAVTQAPPIEEVEVAAVDAHLSVEQRLEPAPTSAPADAADADDAQAEVVPPPARLAFPHRTAAAETPPLDAYSLRLVAGRRLYDVGTLVQHCQSLAGLAPGARLRANPYDLDRLGVTTGGRVRVSSPRASMVLEAEAAPGVPRGSASITFNQPGEGAADLIDVTTPITDVRIETI